jgi:hypothetical protein
MRKTKKLILFLMVGLTLAVPAFGLVPPSEGRAYAAPSDDASVEDQLKSYIYLRAISFCLLQSGLRDSSNQGGPNSTIDLGHLKEYKWFADGRVKTTSLGIYDTDDYSGTKSCSDGGWLDDAFALWGWNDEITAVCYSGFKRSNQDGGQTAESCRNGSVDEGFQRDGSHTDSRRQLLLNVNKQYYGKEGSTEMPTMTDAMKYLYYSQSFIKLCGKNTVRDNPESFTQADFDANPNLKKMYDGNADNTFSVYELEDDDYASGDKKASTRANDTSDGLVDLSCGYLVDQANKYAAAYAIVNPGGVTGSASGDTTGDVDTTCATWDLLDVINPLDWLSCSMLAGFETAAKGLEDQINGMLCISEADIFGAHNTCASSGSGVAGSDDAFHSAWNVFRILALGLLAIGGLIMIISQALGFEIFDAYTVKKTLPRILVAGIGITLSWQILQFFVTLSNGLGIGIRSLIYAPFLHAHIDTVVLGGGAGAIGGLFAIGGFAVLGALGLLSFVGTALLAIVIAFFVLVIRSILVILLIIIAPIAIVAYILPNTEKYFKTWWDWLIKALMVFPIITAFIAIGHVFAALTSQKGDGTLTSVVAMTAYFAPYFLIPLTFRFAGGALSTIGGFANDRSRGGFDRLKKFRQGQSAQNWESIKAGKRWQGNRVGERLSRTLQTGSIAATGGAGITPWRMRSRTQATRSAMGSAMAAEGEKSEAVRTVLGNDDLMSAALHGDMRDADARSYLEGLGQRGQALEQNVASVRAARRALGSDGFNELAAVNNAGTGTGYAGGFSEMADTINRAAGGDRAKAGRMMAAARGQAERAKRIDLYGAGMGRSADMMEQLYADPANQALKAAVNSSVTDEALDVKSAYEVGTARNGGLLNMQPAMRRRIERAQLGVENARRSGNAGEITGAETEFKRVMAHTAGILDAAGSASPENARVAARLMGSEIDLGQTGITTKSQPSKETGTVTARRTNADTVGGLIEQMRGDAVFQRYRREYSSEHEEHGNRPPEGEGH